MYYMDLAGRGSLRKVGDLPVKTTASNQLCVMYEPGKILSVRKRDARVLTLDSSSDQIAVANAGNIASKRFWSDATLLANGEVMISGGSHVLQCPDEAVKPVEIWNPDTNKWRMGAPCRKTRLYHSTSMLLPNGTVLCAGGGPPGPYSNLNAEVYYPDYLFTRSGNWRRRPRLLGEVAHGGSLVEVRAAGLEGTEQIKLQINNQIVATFDLSSEMETYTFETTKPVTGDQVRVNYPGGSSISVDYVDINGVRHETEHPAVYSGEAGVRGYAEIDTLNANGFFRYWDQTAGYLQLGYVPHGSDLNLWIDRSGPIEKALLVRFGSVTHSFDMGQRGMSVPFTQNNGKVKVSLPSQRKLLPPGCYMLFVVNETGTPSRAAMLELQ